MKSVAKIPPTDATNECRVRTPTMQGEVNDLDNNNNGNNDNNNNNNIPC